MSTQPFRYRLRARRTAVVLAAGLSIPLGLACLSARADLPRAALRGPVLTAASAAGQPTPLPCGLSTPTPPVATPSLPVSLPAVPSPLASLLTPCPTTPPLPTATPSSGLGGGTPIPGHGPSPGGTPVVGATVPGGAAPGSPAGSAAYASAPMLPGPLGLLVAPANVGIEAPLLRHFADTSDGTPASEASLLVRLARAKGAAAPPAGLAVTAGLLVTLLLFAGLVLLLRRRSAIWVSSRRLVAVAGMPLAIGAVVGLALAGQRVAPAATAQLASRPAAATGAASEAAAGGVAQGGSTLWARLTTIETTVTQLEGQLGQVAAAPASQDDPTLHPARLGAATTTGSQTPGGVALQLENALQTEYSFYAAAAQSPPQQQALITAASSASPAIEQAVAYNLQAVRTQLAEDAAIQAAQQSVLAGAGPAPTTLLAPEQGAITQGFGPTSFAMEPPLTFDGVTYPHFHTGVDIAAPLDTPVAAAANGVVVIAGSSVDPQGHLVGYGNYIVIASAGKLITLYGHLDKLLVHAGQAVHAGDIIGLEGSSGNSTGPHLHFEVRVAGLLVNPMQYLGSQIQPQ